MTEQRGTHFPNLPPLPDPSKPIKALADAIKGAQSKSEEIADGIVDLRGSGRRLLDFLSRKPWDALPRPKRSIPDGPKEERLPATEPAKAPAVIGPRGRREAPKELEFFADSQEQILTSTNRHRAQMDTAFREAIERVRAGR